MQLAIATFFLAASACAGMWVWAKTATEKADRLLQEVVTLQVANQAAEARAAGLKETLDKREAALQERQQERDDIERQLSRARSEIRRVTNALPEPERVCALDPIPAQYLRLLAADQDDRPDGAAMPTGTPHRGNPGTGPATGRRPVDGDH